MGAIKTFFVQRKNLKRKWTSFSIYHFYERVMELFGEHVKWERRGIVLLHIFQFVPKREKREKQVSAKNVSKNNTHNNIRYNMWKIETHYMFCGVYLKQNQATTNTTKVGNEFWGSTAESLLLISILLLVIILYSNNINRDKLDFGK